METLTAPSQVNIASSIRTFATYNLWANTQLINWLQTKPAEAMDKIVPSSFSSIKATLIHIWGTERYWLSVITGCEYTPVPAPEEFEGTFQDAATGLLEDSAALEAYAAAMTEDDAAEMVYYDSPWVKGYRSRFEYAIHIFNHSTYHRGQVLTIGRNAGLTDGPMTDFNFFNFFGRQ